MRAPTDAEGRKRLLELCMAWYKKASSRDRTEILRLAEAKGGLWGKINSSEHSADPPRSQGARL
jgi:hypothetical protein